MTDANPVEPIKKIADAAVQAVQAEAAPAPVRRYRAWLFRIALLVVAGTFAGLTFLVKVMPSFTVDLQITRSIQYITFPPFAVLMSLGSWPGFSPQSFIITALIIVIIFALGLHWEAVMALIASILSSVINILVKDLIQRPRPGSGQVNVVTTLTSYSFPSGHVMFYVGFFGFMGFLAYSLLKPSLKRTVLLVFLSSLVILVGPSRIYLGEHWASDVLGSYLLGSLVLVATIQIYVWGKTRFFVHQPAVGADGIRPPRKMM